MRRRMTDTNHSGLRLHVCGETHAFADSFARSNRQFEWSTACLDRFSAVGTVGSSSGGADVGSSPRLMRSMTTAACFLHSSVDRSPWRPRVARFSPLGLHHVDLAASGVEPHPEAYQVQIPEQRILDVNGEDIDGALGDSQLASFRHGRPPQQYSFGRRVMLSPRPERMPDKSQDRGPEKSVEPKRIEHDLGLKRESGGYHAAAAAALRARQTCKATLANAAAPAHLVVVIGSIRHKGLRDYWTRGQAKGLNAG